VPPPPSPSPPNPPPPSPRPPRPPPRYHVRLSSLLCMKAPLQDSFVHACMLSSTASKQPDSHLAGFTHSSALLMLSNAGHLLTLMILGTPCHPHHHHPTHLRPRLGPHAHHQGSFRFAQRIPSNIYLHCVC
jgi:hypothetical protein